MKFKTEYEAYRMHNTEYGLNVLPYVEWLEMRLESYTSPAIYTGRMFIYGIGADMLDMTSEFPKENQPYEYVRDWLNKRVEVAVYPTKQNTKPERTPHD